MVTIESNREGSLLTKRPRERMADAPDTRQFRQIGGQPRRVVDNDRWFSALSA
jgi:hypothetical protein